jgi:hypothetical protein
MDVPYLSSEDMKQKRKLKAVYITPEWLANFLKADKDKFEISSEIPSDAQLAGIDISDIYQTAGRIILYFYHDSFAETSEGALIPSTAVYFTRL